MTYRIGWLSPLTPTSGVGTFSNAIASAFPKTFKGEAIDLTILYVGHRNLYQNEHRSIQIGEGAEFHDILTLFDLLVYNIGNNREHHEAIFNLLRLHPGIIVCHDYVYQHYLADRSLRAGKSFSSFAALLLKYGDDTAADYLKRSRITSRTGRIRYSPWDSEASVSQPMSDSVLGLGSALVVHSGFALQHVAGRFNGPVLQLGMPHDQKLSALRMNLDAWGRSIATKPFFNIVSFGHIQPTKCIDRVLSAIAASPILRKRTRYIVAGFVGDRGYFDGLKAMVASLSLQMIVTFEVEVTEARLDELMQQADIFSNLRRPNTEGSSVSLVEQLDTGKPVVVLDSGCYAEIPPDAAIKLPPDITSDHIKQALEALIGRPESMPAIGRAGRTYARTWTCASYASHFLQFASEHRALLEKRARAIAIRSKAVTDVVDTDAWIGELARARASLIYLDLNVLAFDPAIILHKTPDELAAYTANVILGMFADARLDEALLRYFARLDRRQSYWACVRFALIVDAVFGEDEAARERLCGLKPCYDTAFWAIIETFPTPQYIATITLILMNRLPRPDELSTSGLDDQDGFPKRLRMANLLRSRDGIKGAASKQLGRWFEEPCTPTLARALQTVADDFECEVGSAAFRTAAGLSGFHPMESDHAWTRGYQGFIGMSLPQAPITIEVLVHPIDASSGAPCTISLTLGGLVCKTEFKDCVPRWLALELPRGAAATLGIAWIKLSTSAASVPFDSHDKRLLGVCFKRLRVAIRGAANVVSDAPVLVHMHDGGLRLTHQPSTPRTGRRRGFGVDR